MDAPYVFWESLATFISIGGTLLGIWVGSLVYKNIFEAHKKHVFVENNYHNCNIERPQR